MRRALAVHGLDQSPIAGEEVKVLQGRALVEYLVGGERTGHGVIRPPSLDSGQTRIRQQRTKLQDKPEFAFPLQAHRVCSVLLKSSLSTVANRRAWGLAPASLAGFRESAYSSAFNEHPPRQGFLSPPPSPDL